MNRDDLTRLLADAAPLAGWTGDFKSEVTLTSLDVILIVVRLYDQYGIRIPSQEIKRENFRSAEALWELCQKIMGRK
ncbi:MAG: hypothetical protein IJV40_16110 [Oscillospiraceae bacterium]|nr:hypothetical protein [Oscillospiraceae bacterium]